MEIINKDGTKRRKPTDNQVVVKGKPFTVQVFVGSNKKHQFHLPWLKPEPLSPKTPFKTYKIDYAEEPRVWSDSSVYPKWTASEALKLANEGKVKIRELYRFRNSNQRWIVDDVEVGSISNACRTCGLGESNTYEFGLLAQKNGFFFMKTFEI